MADPQLQRHRFNQNHVWANKEPSKIIFSSIRNSQLFRGGLFEIGSSDAKCSAQQPNCPECYSRTACPTVLTAQIQRNIAHCFLPHCYRFASGRQHYETGSSWVTQIVKKWISIVMQTFKNDNSLMLGHLTNIMLTIYDSKSPDVQEAISGKLWLIKILRWLSLSRMLLCLENRKISLSGQAILPIWRLPHIIL